MAVDKSQTVFVHLKISMNRYFVLDEVASSEAFGLSHRTKTPRISIAMNPRRKKTDWRSRFLCNDLPILF